MESAQSAPAAETQKAQVGGQATASPTDTGKADEGELSFDEAYILCSQYHSLEAKD